MHTLDTNAIIYYTDGDHKVADVFENIFATGTPVYISAMTELELFSHSRLTEEDMRALDQFLTALVIMPLDSHVARIAGGLRRAYRIAAADSAIAATALLTGSTLVTRNVRDVRKIPNLELRAI